MKKLSLIAALTLSFLACQKSNLPTIEKWVVKQYKDHTTWSHAFACDSSEYIGLDTIEIKLYSGYDPNKFNYTVGSVYLESQPPVNILDTVDRYYANLLYKLP